MTSNFEAYDKARAEWDAMRKDHPNAADCGYVNANDTLGFGEGEGSIEDRTRWYKIAAESTQVILDF